jgi:hypothetical protein
MCCLTIAEQAFLEQNEPYSNLKTVICSKYSLQNPKQAEGEK